jgi:23S rRNA pseudouridine1911/1915/1917 synthase
LNLTILFEDNHIIIVNKRIGDIVQGDKTGDTPMSEFVKAYIKKKYSKPGDVFLGVVHRIDRPVSGAVIFARTSKALARLNNMLKNRLIRKIYWAVVVKQLAIGNQQSAVSTRQSQNVNIRTDEGKPTEDDWKHLVHYLKRNEKQNKSYSYDMPGPGRSRAEMKYRKAAESDRYDLLEVELITGRHHQIRAQLSAIGRPIRGDLKYGYARSNPDGSIHLHARMIEFIHPVSKQSVKVVAPPPDDTLWNYFVKEVGG